MSVSYQAKKVNCRTVALVFPYATSVKDYPKKFLISFSCAFQSEFIKSLIEGDESKYIEIVIPKDLYLGINHHDLKKFISYWKGEDYLTNHVISCPNSNTCYKDVADLSKALCMNEKLSWIKLLDSKFPPKNFVKS